MEESCLLCLYSRKVLDVKSGGDVGIKVCVVALFAGNEDTDAPVYQIESDDSDKRCEMFTPKVKTNEESGDEQPTGKEEYLMEQLELLDLGEPVVISLNKMEEALGVNKIDRFGHDVLISGACNPVLALVMVQVFLTYREQIDALTEVGYLRYAVEGELEEKCYLIVELENCVLKVVDTYMVNISQSSTDLTPIVMAALSKEYKCDNILQYTG